MKLTRSLFLLILLIVMTFIMTACSQHHITLPNLSSGNTPKEEIIKEKIMTLSIGEKIENSATRKSIVFNGFPNEKTLAFTTREDYLYTSLFLSTDNLQPFPVPILRMTMTIQKIDYQKGTITVKLEPMPVSKKISTSKK